MILIIMLNIIKMATLSTYYQWNGIRISNKKKLEAMSSPVKWKAAAAVERTEWRSSRGGRQGKNRDNARIQGRAAKNVEVCPLSPPPRMSQRATAPGPAQPLPGKRLPLAPFVICDSDPHKFAQDLPSLAETLKGVGSQGSGAIPSLP